MAFENTSGINVSNQYGPRDVGTSVGVERSTDSTHQLSISFTADSLQDTFLPPFVVPRGALFLRYRLRVDEAFTLTGTSPTVIFGSLGSEATNGVVLTATELGTIGTKTPASAGAGTWSTTSTTGVAAAAKVGRVLGGTTPAVTPGAGKATLIAEYEYKTKV